LTGSPIHVRLFRTGRGISVKKIVAAKYLLATSAFAVAAGAHATENETVTYTYDALGRLVATTTAPTSTVNPGLATQICYDPAGNRARYAVSGAAGPAPPPPACPAPPPPPPGNQPPSAVDDFGTMTKCDEQSFAVLANDSDPDGNTPLQLVSVSYTGTLGEASVSGSDVRFLPAWTSGTADVTYTMSDSLGATASAILHISITDGSCNEL
jgi:YD repeat-containing protein